MSNVIAEIGLNHGGDLGIAQLLIKQAKDAGCWGVKFQYRNIESFYHQKDEVGDVIIYDEIKRNFITVDDLMELSIFCKDLSIKFGISVFRVEDLIRLKPILNGIDFFKIPSVECLNIPLLEAIKNLTKKCFVSSGGHKTEEIVEALCNYKNSVILLHCISNYPTCLGTQDLRVISTFKDNGFAQVGYSSHDEDWEVCLVALSQGAKWIERHITLKKTSNGLDHSSSSNVEEFTKLVKFAKNYENLLGEDLRSPNQGELINLQNLGTSLYAKRDIRSGEMTSIDDYLIRAPRIGISPATFVKKYKEKVLQKELGNGKALTVNNFSSGSNTVDPDIIRFAKNKKVGLPVRLHDYGFLKNKFDLKTYEFHLSFSEVLNNNLLDVVTNIESTENISIHLPDYIPGNRLLDPISTSEDIRVVSREIINRVINFSKEIENTTSKKVNIIGSFSQCSNKSRTANLDQIFEYIRQVNGNILPQWLPVYAWYFGGSVKLDIFNSLSDIKYITSNNVKICLDLSHLVMSASYHNANWKDWYNKLLPTVEHVHISDAVDSMSEGLMIGEGLIGNFSEILRFNKLKIIECWQGHINEGEGFSQSLTRLYEQNLDVEKSRG